MRTIALDRTLLPLVALGIAACGVFSTAPNRPTLTLSFSSRAPAPVASASLAPNFDISVTSGANTLVITKAQLVVRKIELKSLATTACSEDGISADDCDEIELGTRLVDLPVSDALAPATTASIPEGTYREIEFKVHKPGTDAIDAAFILANPDFKDISVRVEGTYNGAQFTFTSAVNEEVELEFNPPVVITAASNNITIQVDLRTWFRNTDGTVIDPATANTGGPNASLVASKIKASLRAFEDRDKDGK